MNPTTKSRTPHRLVLLSAACLCNSLALSADLFTAISQQNLHDATPASNALIQKIRSRATSESVQLVKVNVAALTETQTRAGLADKAPVMLSRKSMSKADDNNFSWTGVIKGGVPGDATFVVHDGKLTGTVRKGDELYRIEPVGSGIHAVIKVNEARMPPEHPPRKSDTPTGRADAVPPATVAARSADQPQGPIQITVAVAYTPAAAAAVGDIVATINVAVEESNKSYVNSQVNMTLKLVDTYPIDYKEKPDFDTMVADFANMPMVKQKRDATGADLVALIINQSDYCGQAYDIAPDAEHAFAIIHFDCATGYYSFAHELGHLIGARHDPADDPTNTPFPYGHGYQYLKPPKPWRTIMAYDCPKHCTRLQFWANPNIKFEGVPMGNATVSNDSRVLNERAPLVAQYRQPKPALAATGSDSQKKP